MRVREGCPLAYVGARGLPEKILKKIKQNGAIWSANQAFYTRSSLASSLVILQPVLGLYPSPFSGPNAYCGQK